MKAAWLRRCPARSALVAALVVLTACSDDAGLSRGEVAEMVDEQVAEAMASRGAAPPAAPAALDVADIESAVSDAVAAHEAAHDQPLRAEDIESMVEGLVQEALDADAAAAVQRETLKTTDPALYTQLLVGDAINRYDTFGLDALLAHHNDIANVDGEWYVFVVDGDGTVIGHYDETRRGHNLSGWIGTDVNGFAFGEQMLTATENGKWVPYFYVNPATGAGGDASFELKNAWVVRHNGLLFGSAWYINSEELLPALITQAAEHLRAGGLEAALAFYNDPQGISRGLIPTVQYYNSTDALDVEFSGFIATPDGELLSHINPTLIGTDVEDLLGPAVRRATPQGAWITQHDNDPAQGGPQNMRVWVVDVNGTLIGGGWYRLP